MSNSISQSRSQRRSYENFLKKNNPAEYKKWKSSSKERGKQLSNEHQEDVMKSIEENLESTQTKMILDMRSAGKTNEEIDRHIAIWLKTVAVWGSGMKKMSWEEATKEYELENASK